MSDPYLVLLRGINVGGKNTVSMAELKVQLQKLGCNNIVTYINSGNVIVRCGKKPDALAREIEAMLPKAFKLDSEIVRVLVLTHTQLKEVVAEAPKAFGSQPDTYHSDAIFLMGIDPDEAFAIFSPRQDVDKVWPGRYAVYSQRVSAQRTKSRLKVIMAHAFYKDMTIRSWQTTVKLLKPMDEVAA